MSLVKKFFLKKLEDCREAILKDGGSVEFNCFHRFEQWVRIKTTQ